MATKQGDLVVVMAEQANAGQANKSQLGEIPVLPQPVKPATHTASPARKISKHLPRGTPPVIQSSPASFFERIQKEVLEFFAAHGEGDRAGDKIRILGPLNMEYGHKDLKGIFQLLKLIPRLKTWAEATYWPWFTEDILKSVLDEMKY